jgi:hypothetical protein
MTQPSVTQERVTVCAPSPNPRIKCAKCYRPELCGAAQGPRAGEPSDMDGTSPDTTRPRDMDLEQHFMDTAARAADCYRTDGTGEDFGLSKFADERALPGGVRANMDHRREACEEAADLRNYLVWRAEAVFDAAMAGDAVALDRYEWSLRCLSKLIPLWRELLRDAS